MKVTGKITEYEQMRSMLSIDNEKTLQRMSDVLSILSKLDALEIFVMSKNGLKSELDTPQKIGLTKKQYYTRLKQLYDLDLIAKKGNTYVHTSFGDLIYHEHIVGFLDTISNLKEFEMIDVLKKSSKFNNNEISDFLSRISPGKHTEFAAPKARKTIIIDAFDNMISKALEMIEFSQDEIFIASRFTNDLIINSVLKKATSGVKVRILADTNTVKEFFNNSGKSISKQDKNTDERINVVANPFYPSNIERRYVDIPFSLLIVDNNAVGMEIVDNYNPKKFMLSVYVEDHSFAEQIKTSFNKWWENSSAVPPQPLSKINNRA
ncbi:MAG TPA: hypothetical protein VJR22_01425 [Candidatus Nitrosotalea sp.]|nr:hypothetical protein [Candidatus Nitrosotalea sp.]